MTYFGVDLLALLETVGYVGLCFIIFAETGLFLGFFLPGDSLLFIAGLLAAEGFFSLPLLIVLVIASAIVGNLVGYEFGRRVGPKLFVREDSLLFKKSHVIRAQEFYEKYGGKTLVLARFMPIVRTFVPILAGVGKMRWVSFLAYNIVGAVLWVGMLLVLGFSLGRVVKNVDHYLLPIVIAIVVVSFLPGVVSYVRERRKQMA